MNGKNLETVSFPEAGKETFADRLRALIGARSIRTVAKEWDISFSTLNNYLTRGTEPTLKNAVQISKRARTDLNWLATGQGAPSIAQADICSSVVEAPQAVEVDEIANVWNSILKALTREEATALINTIHRKGIYSLLERAEVPAGHDLVEQFNTAVEKLAPRSSLARAIKAAMLMGLDGDEEGDKEIYEELMASKRTQTPGAKEETLSPVSNEQKKTG